MTTFSILTFIAGTFSLIVTILWLVIGWRAMRAHEKIAENATLLMHYQKQQNNSKPDSDAKQRQLYHRFLNEVTEASQWPLPERQEAFKSWLSEKTPT
ncbi:hypothetical protein HW115_15625 [Verrucomicrobiaceae bacterium N1E253]|uniref:DUF2489 domain-containing protein n=1 Tax=Oceaniferula marina TaxID=2748318 RepID=A0A851GJ85_9BACT|nr:hypothetical protein [Oceaniferula marina]NWK57052.1 hypothetical protein [Oceaniferula marina]